MEVEGEQNAEQSEVAEINLADVMASAYPDGLNDFFSELQRSRGLNQPCLEISLVNGDITASIASSGSDNHHSSKSSAAANADGLSAESEMNGEYKNNNETIYHHSLGLSLPFLDILKIPRSDASRSLTQRLVNYVIDQIKVVLNGVNHQDESIKQMNIYVLSELLRRSMPYVHVDELKEVLMFLLSSHPAPPADTLDLVNHFGGSTFMQELPQQVREKLILSHPNHYEDQIIRPYVDEYLKYENNTFSHSDIMMPTLPKLRESAITAENIANAINSSAALYKRAQDFIREEFITSRDCRLCTLRSDITMKFHEKKTVNVLKSEKIYHFIYYIDSLSRPLVSEFEKKLDTIFAQLAIIDPHMSFVPEQAPTAMDTRNRALAEAKEAEMLRQLQEEQSKSSEEIIPYLRNCIDRAKEIDTAELFFKPVIEQYPHITDAYKAKIKLPMDISTMQKKLKSKKYKTFDSVRHDLRLIYDNCMLYNGDQYKVQATAFLNQTLNECNNLEASFVAMKSKQIQQLQEDIKNKKVISNAPSPRQSVASMSSLQVSNLRNQMIAEGAMMLDCLIVLSDRKVVGALVRHLWDSVQRDLIEKERLPRESRSIQRLIYLLCLGDYINTFADYYADLRASDTESIPFKDRPALPKYESICLYFERDFLTELMMIRISASLTNAVVESGPVTDTQPNCKVITASNAKRFFPARHQFFQALFDSLRETQPKKGHVPYVQTLISICEELAEDDLLALHPGFILSLDAVLAKPIIGEIGAQQSANNTSSRSLILRNIFIPCLKSPSIANDTTIVSKMHQYFAKTMVASHPHLKNDEFLEILKEGCDLISHGMVKPSDNDNIPPNDHELIISRYNDPDFASARKEYEKVFALSPQSRDYCKIPLPDQAVNSTSNPTTATSTSNLGANESTKVDSTSPPTVASSPSAAT